MGSTGGMGRREKGVQLVSFWGAREKSEGLGLGNMKLFYYL